ncbi:hypothetical protein [Stutzerimonas chloritidismutans]|uniref:hypothetical protein n=1 Tax=Stutzerimonas chloritidismutans TaxID=203192 RepID=UPI003850C62F
MLEDSFAFVIMPFSSEFDDIYKLAIKQAANESNVKAERLDEQLFSEGMLERIYRQIDISDFIIADLSTRNANVFYELGYAHAKDKICILLTKDANDIPFDLRHKRHIVYGDSISYLKSELAKNIEWAKNESASKKTNKIQVISKPVVGDLKTDKHSATATIGLAFELQNKTKHVSPDITAIYLYTQNEWLITIEKRECQFSDSDLEGYRYRYFIQPPIQRIGRNGFAQIKAKAVRTIANAWKGDTIQDRYSLHGLGVIRIETTEGYYDQEFDIVAELIEIPF